MEYQGCGNQGTCIYLDLKELKAREIAYVYVWLERSYDPPEGSGGQRYSKMYRLKRYRYTIFEKKIV